MYVRSIAESSTCYQMLFLPNLDGESRSKAVHNHPTSSPASPIAHRHPYQAGKAFASPQHSVPKRFAPGLRSRLYFRNRDHWMPTGIQAAFRLESPLGDQAIDDAARMVRPCLIQSFHAVDDRFRPILQSRPTSIAEARPTGARVRVLKGTHEMSQDMADRPRVLASRTLRGAASQIKLFLHIGLSNSHDLRDQNPKRLAPHHRRTRDVRLMVTHCSRQTDSVQRGQTAQERLTDFRAMTAIPHLSANRATHLCVNHQPSRSDKGGRGCAPISSVRKEPRAVAQFGLVLR